MKKPILTECEPIQSIKILDININELKHELLNEMIQSEIRKEKEGKLLLLVHSRNDLQTKHEKHQKSRSKPRLPSLRSDKPMNKSEIESLIHLVENPLPETIKDEDDRLIKFYSGQY